MRIESPKTGTIMFEEIIELKYNTIFTFSLFDFCPILDLYPMSKLPIER